VGPNGAGKTSTMRMLTTLMRPTSGEAYVAGYAVTDKPRNVRRAIGYMPDFFGVYDDMRVWEYLDFFAACYDIPERERTGLVDDLLELVDLQHRKNDMVDKLSRGMKQRLCLARTLAHDPQVLILDEPASGLDPRARIEIRELLVELASDGQDDFLLLAHPVRCQRNLHAYWHHRGGRDGLAQGSMEEMQRQLMPHREITITFLSRRGHGRGRGRDWRDRRHAGHRPRSTPPRRAARASQVQFSGEDEGVALISRELSSAGNIAIVGLQRKQERNLEAVFMQRDKRAGDVKRGQRTCFSVGAKHASPWAIRRMRLFLQPGNQ
jgi:ABC-2 type transport system ATP-binding protein